MKDLDSKLAVLADAAKYDASCAVSVAHAPSARPDTPPGIYVSTGPDGRPLALLKILLTNECIYDCSYCIHRRSSDVVRARFSPDEVVALTLDYHRRGLIDGLFLSSGVIESPDATMEQLVSVARSLRRTHHYFGYIHLKTIPDCSEELITEAGRWADRLSVNIEMPRQSDLDRLAPEKTLVRITRAMNVIRSGIDEAADARSGHGLSESGETRRALMEGARGQRFAPAGQTTQMIVGATDASDAEVLLTAVSLYARQKLRRVYYSAYIPIPDAPGSLPDSAPPAQRERRLYQADWLIRDYGFTVGDLTPPGAENLDLSVEPKLAWALRNPDRFPIDVNRAPKSELLRVPGFGRTTVARIIETRRRASVRVADLAAMRVPLGRALPFITTADRVPPEVRPNVVPFRASRERGSQLELFSSPPDRQDRRSAS